MGRTERFIDPSAGPVERFAHDLRLLRRAAGGLGYRQLARRAHYSVTALSQAAAGRELPTLEVTLAYVSACGGDAGEWTDRWHRVSEKLGTGDASPRDRATDSSPYRGLAPFQPADSPWFFGREKLVADMIERLRVGRLLAVFGPSGSGKSSAIRAGLVPAIRSLLPRSENDVPVVLFAPGDHPLREFADRLRASAPRAAAPLSTTEIVTDPAVVSRALNGGLIVVDQFEEIFTLCADAEERSVFVDALLAAAADPASETRVVIGIRAEFYGRCAEHPKLVTALRDRQLLVGPMSPEELRSVIVGPAAKVGLTADAGLVGGAVADALRGGGAGALPLLSHVLLQTWRCRSGTALTLADYRAAGGLSGAIARTADQVYDSCEPNQRRRIKQVFLRLTAAGSGPDDVRRRVRRSDLLDANGIEAEVLDRLVAERLLTTDEDGVEIAHEALIREWPTLRGWLEEDRDGLRLHRALTEASADWILLGRDPGALWRSARLNAAREWAGAADRGLTDSEQTFLDAGIDRERGELALANRRNRKLRMLAAALVVLVALVGSAGAVAVQQRQVAQHERDVSIAGKLAVQAAGLTDQQPLSLLLALESLRLAPNDAAYAALLAGVLEPQHNSLELVGHLSTVYGVAFDPDGNTVVTGGEDRTIRRWDTRSGAPIGATLVGHKDPVTAVAVSQDAAMLVSASDDDTVRRWNTATGALIEPVLIGHYDNVKAVAISRDGRLIASASKDGTVRRWDAKTGAQLGDPMRGHAGGVWAIAISPDGTTIASGGDDGTVRIWDAATGALRAELPGGPAPVRALAISPDNAVVVAGTHDGTVRRLDMRTGDLIGRPLTGHTGGITGAAVTPNGRTIVTAGRDRTVRRWDMADGAPLAPLLTGHTDQVRAVAISPDGSMIATASRDRTARLWRSNRAAPLGPTLPDAGQVARMAVNRDHTEVVWTGQDGVLRRWDLAAGAPIGTPMAEHTDEIRMMAYSADGTMLVTGAEDRTVRRWDLTTGGQLGPPLIGHAEEVARVALTPDDSVIVSGGFGSTIRRWDARTGTPLGDPLVGDGSDLSSLAVTPDSSMIVSSGGEFIWRWDTRTGGALGPPMRGHLGLIEAVAVSPDGAMIASVGADRTARRWDAATGEAIGDPLVGHGANVTRVAFTPDRTQIVSVDVDGVVRRWDRATGEPVGRPMAHYIDFVGRIALSTDGTLLGAALADGRLQVFPADPRAWIRRGCASAGRNLTLREWQTFHGPEVEYVRTCPNLSADVAAPDDASGAVYDGD